MTVPVLMLLGFAVWTILLLLATVGVYRWSRILTGRVPIGNFRADQIEGADWYKRAMRAHANCLENLRLYTAVVVAIAVTGVRSIALDWLAIVLLAARVCQTFVHIALTPTNLATALRFIFFAIQMICMVAMGLIVVRLVS